MGRSSLFSFALSNSALHLRLTMKRTLGLSQKNWGLEALSISQDSPRAIHLHSSTALSHAIERDWRWSPWASRCCCLLKGAAVHRSRPLRFEFGDAVPMCSVWVRSVISTTAGYLVVSQSGLFRIFPRMAPMSQGSPRKQARQMTRPVVLQQLHGTRRP